MTAWTDVDREVEALRGLVSRARTLASTSAWQKAMARRTARVSSVLRALPRVIASAVTRVKVPGEWHVFSGCSTLVMIVDIRTPARTIADLERPFVVRVVHPALVRDDALDRLAVAKGFIVEEP